MLRWYHTVRCLKAEQIWYRLAYPVIAAFRKPHRTKERDIYHALLIPQLPLASLEVPRRYDPDRKAFSFLNRSVAFPEDIEWDYAGEGLLWTYNLAYFEWLYDETISVEERLETIHDFVRQKTSQKAAGQPYPISLRAVAWTRFLLKNGIKEENILRRLYSDVHWLYHFPERHLQGNHLWENAVALLCAGLFFRENKFCKKGSRLLNECLEAQVLPDGGHVEGSPMYHSLLLWRLLQSIELMKYLPAFDNGLEKQLCLTAGRMMGWLQAMTFDDGTWPMFNDCAPGVAPTTKQLSGYIEQLGIAPDQAPLNESGYRMIRSGPFEIAFDTAKVQPGYQPGHAHADIGTFCLHFLGRPFIVDTGISGYDASLRRSYERSTRAHNTVAVGGQNSSEVWKSFRMGRRVEVLSVEEGANSIAVSYAPFAFPRLQHIRTFSWNDNCIRVDDQLQGGTNKHSDGYLHFHPDIRIEVVGDGHLQTEELDINFKGAEPVRIDSYQFAAGFNQLRPAACAHFSVTHHLIIEITAKRFHQTNTELNQITKH